MAPLAQGALLPWGLDPSGWLFPVGMVQLLGLAVPRQENRRRPGLEGRTRWEDPVAVEREAAEKPAAPRESQILARVGVGEASVPLLLDLVVVGVGLVGL